MAAILRIHPIEGLVDALQDFLNEAAERTVARLEVRLDRQDATIREMQEHLDTRLDRHDDTTLRMVWKQVKDDGKLPIDD